MTLKKYINKYINKKTINLLMYYLLCRIINTEQDMLLIDWRD